MKIEKLDRGVYRMSETLSSRRVLMKASELIQVYEWVLLHMAELEQEAKEEEELLPLWHPDRADEPELEED